MNPLARNFVLHGLFGILLLMLGISMYQRAVSPGMRQSLHTEKTLHAATAPSDDTTPQQMRNSYFSAPRDPEAAEKLVQLMEHLQSVPGDPELLLKIARIFLENNAWGQADAFLARAALAAPKDFRPHYFMGMSKSGQGLYQEAAQAFTESLRRETNPAAQFDLAIVYKYHLSQLEKADILLRHVSISSAADEYLRHKATQELEKK